MEVITGAVLGTTCLFLGIFDVQLWTKLIHKIFKK